MLPMLTRLTHRPNRSEMVAVLGMSCSITPGNSNSSPANTFKNLKYMFYLRGLVVIHILEHCRTDQIKSIVSQVNQAHHRRC
jgi:hypothetical protein